MYDPTVFDNLKVAFENRLYDLDNLDGTIRIVNRTDRLEMAVMSRQFSLSFTLAHDDRVTAEIVLETSLEDLAAEILERERERPGCKLLIRFHMTVGRPDEECPAIAAAVRDVWQPELEPTQTLTFVFGVTPVRYRNTVEIGFRRKIDEEQMSDIPELADFTLRTLEELRERWT